MLENINTPQDLKSLTIAELETLAQDIRGAIINRVNLIGGHLGPDLGIVEATIAMHYVFNSPIDKFVFDISHQCYPHKILTARKQGFTDPLEHPEISGYSNPKESVHDHFVIGHTSTSVSLATGLAKARDLKGEKYNVIALIGDGSLSGGEAFEGLNNASVLNSNFIIIVNDNEMSIAENQGGLYKNLEELRRTNGTVENNIFKTLGFNYLYLEDGNNVEKLIDIFQTIKDTNMPVIVHIHTLKGKGFEPAVNNKEAFHWTIPGFLNEKSDNYVSTETYTSLTVDYLLQKKLTTPELMVISPATPGATGFTKNIREMLGKNYTDVGIAEEHAVAYASGLATNGAKPVLAVLSSFIQRAYDQLSQDLALNNSPATILVYWGGISSADMTHLQTFDIPLISNIPNIVYLAPTNKEEYIAMLNWSIEQNKHPVAIRVPECPLISTGIKDTTDYSILNKYQVEKSGDTVAVIGLGSFFELAKTIHEKLSEQLGINSTLINPKFISGVDKDLLNNLVENHKLVVTLEDGVLDGGFGEKISRFYAHTNMKVLNYGGLKEFTDRISLDELYKRYRLTPEQIMEDIENIL